MINSILWNTSEFTELMDKGLSQIRDKEYEDAISTFDRILDIIPNSVIALHLKSVSRLLLTMESNFKPSENSRQLQESISDLEKVIFVMREWESRFRETRDLTY